MNCYLLRYDRPSRQLLDVEEFEWTDRALATQARFDAELNAFRAGRHIEVVLLQAASLDTLKESHASYFRRADGILARAIGSLNRR